MAASGFEQELAASVGVRILANAAPVAATPGGMAFAYSDDDGTPGPERFEVAADEVLTAIGQTLGPVPEALTIEGGKIAVTGPGRTSAAPGLGRRRLRLGRRRPDRDRGRRGPRRRHGHPRNAHGADGKD